MIYDEKDNQSDSLSTTNIIDEYALSDLNLITPERTVSLKAMMLEISYYEDIFNCITSGHILIKDSISLIDTLGLCGNEYLKLSFKRNDKAREQFIRYFRVYRVSERIQDNQFTETYSLHFCSEELFLSEQIKITKSYKNKGISEIIYDILAKGLQIPANRIILDEAKGLYDYIVTNKKPFEAVNRLTNIAQPFDKGDTTDGADFLFFENQDGFNFLSLEKMYKKQPYARYGYNVNNAGRISGGPNGTTDELSRSLTGIKSYRFLDTFDSLYGTVTGAFANSVRVVDPIQRTHKEVRFDYKKYFESDTNLNRSPVIGFVKNRLGKYPNENYQAVFKEVQTNTGQKKALHLRDTPSEFGNDIMPEVFVPYRTAQLALATYSRLRIILTGDPNLSVGKIIEVYLPSNVSNSGKYLITSVRHIIDSKFKYEVVVEVAKNSFSKQFPSTESNPDYIKAKKGEK